ARRRALGPEDGAVRRTAAWHGAEHGADADAGASRGGARGAARREWTARRQDGPPWAPVPSQRRRVDRQVGRADERLLGGRGRGRAAMSPRRALLVVAVGLAAALMPGMAHATHMTIVNNDPAGQGLSDPTPFVPVGGNNATTLGAARLAALQKAADLWSAQ